MSNPFLRSRSSSASPSSTPASSAASSPVLPPRRHLESAGPAEARPRGNSFVAPNPLAVRVPLASQPPPSPDPFVLPHALQLKQGGSVRSLAGAFEPPQTSRIHSSNPMFPTLQDRGIAADNVIGTLTNGVSSTQLDNAFTLEHAKDTRQPSPNPFASPDALPDTSPWTLNTSGTSPVQSPMTPDEWTTPPRRPPSADPSNPFADAAAVNRARVLAARSGVNEFLGLDATTSSHSDAGRRIFSESTPALLPHDLPPSQRPALPARDVGPRASSIPPIQDSISPEGLSSLTNRNTFASPQRASPQRDSSGLLPAMATSSAPPPLPPRASPTRASFMPSPTRSTPTFSATQAYGDPPAPFASPTRTDTHSSARTQSSTALSEAEYHDGEPDFLSESIPAVSGFTLHKPSSPDATLSYPSLNRVSRRPPVLRQPWAASPKSSGVRCAAVSVSSGCVAIASDKLRLWFAGRAAATGEEPVKLTVDLGLPRERDNRPVALAFPDNPDPALRGRSLWVGTEAGDLVAIDVDKGLPVDKRTRTGGTSGGNRVSFLCQVPTPGCPVRSMVVVWDSGAFLVFAPASDQYPPSVSGRVRPFRGAERVRHLAVCGSDLWCAPEGGHVEVYRVPGLDAQTTPFRVDRLRHPADYGGSLGIAALLGLNLVVTGHRAREGETVIVTWDAVTRASLRSIRACAGISPGLCAVGSDRLWVSGPDGRMFSLRGNRDPAVAWEMEKVWSVPGEFKQISADETGPLELSTAPTPLAVVTLSADGIARVWDGFAPFDAVEEHLRAKEDMYCTYGNLRVWLGSFNLDAAKPSDVSAGADANFAHGWVRDHLHPDWEGGPPDVCVFGLQEVVDLQNTGVAAKKFFQGTKKGIHEESGAESRSRYRAWQDKLHEALVSVWPREGFEAVDSTGLVGLFLCVFVRQAVRTRISEVHVDTVKTGLGGSHGNKGAIAVRLVAEDTSMAFCNVHLAAHSDKVASRLVDAVSIVEDSGFPMPAGRGNGRETAGVAVSFAGGGNGTMLMDHESVFFFGDLNFRIDEDPNFGRLQCEWFITRRDWPILAERDQLERERRKPAVLESPLRMFQEGDLNFAPTFKYDPGSDLYDTSEKRRMPSWCDRILFRGNNILQKTYARHECRLSDHRPVCASFEVRVKRIDRKKMSDAYLLAETEVLKDTIERWRVWEEERRKL